MNNEKKRELEKINRRYKDLIEDFVQTFDNLNEEFYLDPHMEVGYSESEKFQQLIASDYPFDSDFHELTVMVKEWGGNIISELERIN